MTRAKQELTLESLLAESERARAEAEAAHAEAAAANRAKSDFLATMSHELRTPLNAVLGYAQLLAMGVLGPLTIEQHEQLQRLEASAQHLLHLVNDVLDVAKADAEQLQVRTEALTSSTATTAAIALIQQQATARGVRVLDMRPGSGVAYVGDEHRVRQILVNLLSNAVKFTSPGGMVTLDCGLVDGPASRTPAAPHHVDSGTSWAWIRVSDTGAGMSPELLQQIFEPFVQGNPQATAVRHGTGLGLAISRRLARLMGGDITVTSEPGHGSTFTLWLPSPDEERPPPGATPPLGIPALRSTSTQGPASGRDLQAGAFPILHALGARLAASTEPVSERYVEALRQDGNFPGATELTSAQLRDHVTPVIGLFAAQLMIIGETRGEIPDLLRDGGQLQKYMSELHGEQRLRLGWSENDIEREARLLAGEVESALRQSVDGNTTLRWVASPEAQDIDRDALEAATTFATHLARQVFQQSARAAIRAYRQAKVNPAE